MLGAVAGNPAMLFMHVAGQGERAPVTGFSSALRSTLAPTTPRMNKARRGDLSAGCRRHRLRGRRVGQRLARDVSPPRATIHRSATLLNGQRAVKRDIECGLLVRDASLCESVETAKTCKHGTPIESVWHVALRGRVGRVSVDRDLELPLTSYLLRAGRPTLPCGWPRIMPTRAGVSRDALAIAVIG